ncbi:MAG: hypothetical protein KZY55_12380 [Paeniclostridium sp.]|nr:hypothetical protein [Paeniclostridium sp.]MBW4861492.1 hypothetical protein [Paeniclostridium sp.]MBW4874856.1 hypothetical protein [Paeniclostridium sp.]
MSSFEGLYTFADVSSMYNIDQSTLRRNVGVRFIDGEDAKKLGKTWIVREEALIREFGFIPKVKDKKVSNVKKKVGRKSSFDKCKEAYLNSK